MIRDLIKLKFNERDNMEAFKNILFNVLIVVGLIAIILTAIWWLLELLNKIFNFSKYIIMYHQYKKKEDLYDLRNKVIVAKDGEISYSCVGDIDEQIVILNKGIENGSRAIPEPFRFVGIATGM